MSIFTHKERTEKCKTLGNAVAQARSVLLHFYRINKLCCNKIGYRNLDEEITIKEMSELVNELVDDTLYYEGYFTNIYRLN